MTGGAGTRRWGLGPLAMRRYRCSSLTTGSIRKPLAAAAFAPRLRPGYGGLRGGHPAAAVTAKSLVLRC